MFEPNDSLEPPRPPVHGLRVVGVLYEPAGPVVLSWRRPEPQPRLDAHHARLLTRTTASCSTPGPTSPTCCTSRTSRWALLRVPGHRARLRERRRDDLRARPAGPADARHLEPAAVVHRRHPGRPARRTSSRCRTSSRPPRTEPCPRSRGSTRTAPSPSTRRRSSAPARPTSPGLVNAIMHSPDWDSTAIFLAWDDWGGFYDHVVPPVVDRNGFGLRVPGHRDQPVRQDGLHRPPDPQLRRLHEVHRGRLHQQRPPRSRHRRPPRPPARRPRGQPDPRQPRGRLRLQPDAPRRR